MPDPIVLTVQGPETVALTPEEIRVIKAVSPTVTTERITGGAVITITDVDGAHTVTVYDGADGRGIANAVLNADYTLTITYTDGTSYTTPSIRGERGAGITSIVKTGTSGLVDTYTITYGDGQTATFTVTNGADGNPGPGVPAGGTTRQIIQKASATDYATEWANNPADMVATVEPDTTADQAYTAGEVFVLNNKLYKADEAIVQGGTITPGTNCHETTIRAEILANFSVKTGTSVPTTSTAADYVGQLYLNTGTDRPGFYICTNADNGVYSWNYVYINIDRSAGGVNILGKPSGIGNSAVSIGYESRGGSVYGVAIGAYADCRGSYAVQIGSGRNDNNNTFQYKNYRIVEADGTIPPERITSANWSDAQRLAVLQSLGCSVDANGFVKWTAQPAAE